MWELDHKEVWVPKNWCFSTVVLEKTLESALTAKRSNLSILKEINPEYSLEGLLLKLKWRANSLEKPLILGKIESRKRRRWQRTRWLDAIIDSTDIDSQSLVKDREGLPCGSPWVAKTQTGLSDWKITASILAWEIVCIEEPGDLQSMGSQKLDRT